MSEAWGSILIKVPKEILSEVDLESDELSIDTIKNIFEFSENSSLLESKEFLFENSGFSHEGIKIKKGFLYITTFGDEWMEMIKDLIENSKNIQVYGSIYHEYGYKEYYALNDQGKTFVGTHDAEGGDDEEALTEIESKWNIFVPENVRNSFPEVFSNEESDEE
jgi:hypothetical protein